MSEEKKEFQWATSHDFSKPSGDPVTGEIAIVNIPVKVAFVWSDKIVEDVDECGNPVSFRSGYIMEVLPGQSCVFENQPRKTEAYGYFEKR